VKKVDGSAYNFILLYFNKIANTSNVIFCKLLQYFKIIAAFPKGIARKTKGAFPPLFWRKGFLVVGWD